MEKFLTITQAAEYLNVTPQTIRAWDKAGKINTVRTPGNQRRIPQSEIKRLLYLPVEPEPEQGQGYLVAEKSHGDAYVLMCRDIPVYDILSEKILDKELLPGAILRKTLDYTGWMKTRYSAGSNTSARRLMLRAFGSDNHANTLKDTRALSLSDCYWLRHKDECVSFDDITPYIHTEWDGTGVFSGGSLSTLFVNGAADKCWLDSKTLLKISSFNEIEPYLLCKALGLSHVAETELSEDGLLITNFTSPGLFFESMEQSGFVKDDENPRDKAVELFGELAVALFVVDYLVEHDDRHWGNYGFLRDSSSGKYVQMAPYFDFDWAWSGGVTPLPHLALLEYGKYIKDICVRAKGCVGAKTDIYTKKITAEFKNASTIIRRADELLGITR